MFSGDRCLSFSLSSLAIAASPMLIAIVMAADTTSLGGAMAQGSGFTAAIILFEVKNRMYGGIKYVTLMIPINSSLLSSSEGV